MPSSNRAQPRFLRLAEVLEMTGMGKTFIYARFIQRLLREYVDGEVRAGLL